MCKNVEQAYHFCDIALFESDDLGVCFVGVGFNAVVFVGTLEQGISTTHQSRQAMPEMDLA